MQYYLIIYNYTERLKKKINNFICSNEISIMKKKLVYNIKMNESFKKTRTNTLEIIFSS